MSVRPSPGGCAVYGCGSTSSRELTLAAYWRRLVRLGLALLLFPRRVRIAPEVEGARPGWRAAVATASRVLPWRVAGEVLETWRPFVPWKPRSFGEGFRFAFVIVTCLVGFFGVVGLCASLGPLAPWWTMLPLLLVPVAPFLVALAPLLALEALRASWSLARRAFQAELGALGRPPESRETVLDRLRESSVRPERGSRAKGSETKEG